MLLCLNEIPLTISVSHTLRHMHISTCTHSLWPSQCFPPALLTGVAPTRRHTDNRSQTHTQSHAWTRPYRAFFPILGLHNGHFVHIPSPPSPPAPKLSTPALTINPPLASSTSLSKWEIMQMGSHHRGTPHISDVHSVRSIVCVWEHVWASAHECSNSPRDGYGLNKQSTSQMSSESEIVPLGHEL